jgi:hypothetical protein
MPSLWANPSRQNNPSASRVETKYLSSFGKVHSPFFSRKTLFLEIHDS